MLNLKPFGRLLLFCAFLTTFSACKKNKDDSNPKEPELQYNQIREDFGIRFILSWTVADGSYAQDFADLDLELYKGVGEAKSATPMKLEPKADEFINYSILTDSLTDGGEYTLALRYGNVTKNGKFDLHVEGYTAIQNKKNFKLVNNPFTTANTRIKKDFLKIKREGNVYTFEPL